MVLNQNFPLGYEYKPYKVELLAICRSANINTLLTLENKNSDHFRILHSVRIFISS